jgi:UDP-N-acetyl-D-mannosaminuronate dehydrogenase
MARVRSTARVSREGDDAEVTETAPISEVMRRSGLVVLEGAATEGETAEAEQTVVEDRSDDKNKEDNNILSPSKSSHIEFGKSTVSVTPQVLPRP